MSPIDKLKAKLAELFQLDQADLDFGIYRIMNAKRDEITRFLDRDLLPQVEEAFKQYKSSDKAVVQKELDKVIEGVKAAGLDPEQAPRVKELRAQLAEAVDLTAVANEVYDHLYSFFSRYYDDGDFISMRRYKEGVYAIPYEGEEVKLHWANSDQYYIKTTEYFRDYAFRLPDGRRVHFKIVAADTEKDNIKAPTGNDRRFLLHGDKPVAEENGELVIRFEYRPDEAKRRQDAINAATARRIMEALNPEPLAVWQHRLSARWKRADGTETDRTILEKHLYDYTRRNTFDYFIHKDLGRFLRRELDFYIKNEVMHLDDVENESAPRVEQYLSKVRVIRRIAHKLIAFLAQIEDFQKRLWLKKKFVVETNYCVTLDRVPEELYPEIAKNDGQREEWVRLFAIDEIKADLAGQVAYSKTLAVKFLKANPHLVLDTKFFDHKFKDRLLASWDNIEDQYGGVLISSENFQALTVLASRYVNGLQCIYIDPPYNTDASAILYKNDYKNASWLSLVACRCANARHLLVGEGIMCVAIDDVEFPYLRSVLRDLYGEDHLLGIAAVRANPAGRSTPTGFSVAHDYAIFVARSQAAAVGRLQRSEKQLARYDEKDEKGPFEWVNFRKHGGTAASRAARPRMYFPFYLSKGQLRIPAMEWNEAKKAWDILERPQPGEEVIWPIGAHGDHKRWKWGVEAVKEHIADFCARPDQSGTIGIYFKSRMNGEGTLPLTWWDKKEYSATEYGTNLLTDIFGKVGEFSFPKAIHLVEDCLRVCAIDEDGTALDFFGGSGTTGHAVINLNREDGGKRKYILVEMGDYFDSVLKPRIQKIVYSRDWKDGKPVSRDTGVSHMFKYIRLESYEDALANLRLARTGPQQTLLDKSDAFRESYMLRYMLDVESKGSASLLDLDRFDDPFSYQLLVGTGSVGETKPVTVDLVETFNWLLGLKVKHIDRIEGFQIVEGTDPKGQKVLVIWRKVRDLAEKDPKKIEKQREKSNEALEAFFRKQQYNTLDLEFDVIYVNGDNNLMNIPVEPEKPGVEPRYKVRLIEDEFKRLMFDVKDV